MTTRQWRFIDTGTGSAAWNMAVDEALLRCMDAETLPVLRLYRWERAFSLGRFSDSSILAETPGTARVRRITGGGVLPHGEDLSYALVYPRTLMESSGVKEGYRHLCGFLVRFYAKLGLDARFACDEGESLNRSALCLAGREAYDLLIGAKKMGGNAQRHVRSGVLHHGSIPLAFGDAAALLPGSAEAQSLRALEVEEDSKRLSELLAASFEEYFGVQLCCEELSEAETALAQKLLKEKYANEEWTRYGRTKLA